MRPISKKIMALSLTLTMTAGIFTGCGIKTDTPILGHIFGLSSDEIFKVDSLTCSDSEYKLLFMNYVNQYKKEFGGKIDWNANVDKDTTFKDYIMEKTKNDISIKYTMAAMAESEGIKLDKDDMEIVNDAAQEYYNSMSVEDKDYTGADLDTITGFYSTYYLADKVFNRVTENVEEQVSEEDARVVKIQYAKMTLGQHTEKEIRKQLNKLIKGVKKLTINFAQEAKQITEDDSVEKVLKKNEAKTVFEQEAFNVAKGHSSDIIQDGNDFYVIYCVDNYLKDETAANKNKIIEDKKNSLFKEKYDVFVKDTSIDINTSEWEDIVPEDVDSTSSYKLISIYNNTK